MKYYLIVGEASATYMLHVSCSHSSNMIQKLNSASLEVT